MTQMTHPERQRWNGERQRQVDKQDKGKLLHVDHRERKWSKQNKQEDSMTVWIKRIQITNPMKSK